MNNWDERLNAKVRAQNKVNARANALHPELLEIFRPYVGKKILTNSGFVAKLKPALAALRERESAAKFQLCPGSTTYTLSFSLRGWESYNGEQYGGASAEATLYVGDMNRPGSGVYSGDALATLHTEPPALRTDYSADEVRELRKTAAAAEQAARDAESALFPFGKYDN